MCEIFFAIFLIPPPLGDIFFSKITVFKTLLGIKLQNEIEWQCVF